MSKSEIARIASQLGWFDAAVTLPANAEHVLIATKMWKYAHHGIRGEGHWRDESMDLTYTDDEREVTHWMPLPRNPNTVPSGNTGK